MADEPRSRRAPDARATPRRDEDPAAAPSPGAHAGASPAKGQPSVLWAIGAAIVVVAAIFVMRGRGAPDEERREIIAVGRDGRGAERGAAPERLRVRVVRSYPHARDAFTQGLVWHEGTLYESTGQYGRSSLRRVDLESGEVRERRELPARIFAEGLALAGDRLYQLSWMEGEARVWSLSSLEPLRTFEYEGEGWGLCFDGTDLVMSDGSDRLDFRDPETFEVRRTVRVRDRGEPIDQLNELECVDGAVWANVWQSERIVRIDPRSGRVTAVADASGLLEPEERRGVDVLNGIAWIPERQRFVITGKLWPRMFEVEMIPAD